LDTIQIVTIEDVLDRFTKVKKHIEALNRDIKNELLQNLKEKDIDKMTSQQYKNLNKFLELLSEDECMSYLLHVLDTNEMKSGSNSRKLLKEDWKKYTSKMKDTIWK
jgi:hypothetical protein